LSQKPRKPKHFPEKKDILTFIQESTSKVGKKEIARAFGIKGVKDRAFLKKVLREMKTEGMIEKGHRRNVHAAGELPAVTIIEVTELDVDGELYARPASWDGEDTPPKIIVTQGRSGAKAMAPGDRALARLKRLSEDLYEARIMRAIGGSEAEVVGVFQLVNGQGRIQPTDRRAKTEYAVTGPDSQGAAPGDVVLAEVVDGRKLGLKQARVRELVGPMSDPRTFSLIALKSHGIRNIFPEAALAEAEAASPTELGDRTDLRDVPLITIDPPDARDHDDAVWAEADPDPKNPGGWKVLVAIADVAAYVRNGSALDREALLRGNSTYFPDRVVPMLPEALSAGLCSLVPDQDRACMAVYMWLRADGKKLRHEFVRGLMRSRARFSYAQVQTAIDGIPDDATAPLLESVLKPLYGAYASICEARKVRQPLDLDLPELGISLGEDGRVSHVAPRVRLDAHKLVEEFMIAANVAAAETLEKKRTPCMYRVHEAPADDKVTSLREFLDTLDYNLSKGQALKPHNFNSILAKVRGTAHEPLVNTVVLRSQSQAIYSPDNAGHFGLALKRYAHFTSPIRRYADLLVHRGLISSLGLGDEGLEDDAGEKFVEIGEQISTMERRSSAAEREANDRYMAAYLESRTGATFAGRISGVARFGLFVTLTEIGADGLVPIRDIGIEYFHHDETNHALVGEQSGTAWRLGDIVEVKVVEADAITGSVRLELLSESSLKITPDKSRENKGRGRPNGRRGRPKNIRHSNRR
jgi:ribonuclease R